MIPENEQKIKDLVGAIRSLVRAVYLDTSKMSRQYGLTGSQSGVLRTLYQKGSLSSADLSRQLHVTPSNITGIIDRLEKKGLVQRVRKAEDRRVALINLTDSGQELSRSLPDPIETTLIRGLAYLDPSQVDRLGHCMSQILNLIDAKEVVDTPLELYAPDSNLNQ